MPFVIRRRHVVQALALLGLAASLVSIIESATVGRLAWWMSETVVEILLVLWTRAAVIFAVLTLSGAVGALLFQRDLKTRILGGFRQNRLRSVTGLVAFAAAHFVLTILLVQLMYFDMLPAPEARDLFPQVASSGRVAVRTYGANGGATYRFVRTNIKDGPEHGYARLTFRTFGTSVEYNCGWVMFLLRGIDLARFASLHFLVKGEQGGERIGVKAKDVRGIEGVVALDAPPPGAMPYLPRGGVTNEWQAAVIPLDHFGSVDFGLLENISIFTTGSMAGVRRQVLFVGGFRLRD